MEWYGLFVRLAPKDGYGSGNVGADRQASSLV